MLEKLLKNIKKKGLPLLASIILGCGNGETYYSGTIVKLSIKEENPSEYVCVGKVYIDGIEYLDPSNIEFLDKFDNSKEDFREHKIKVKALTYDWESSLTLKVYNKSPRFEEAIWECNGHYYYRACGILCYNDCIGPCLKEPDGE